MSIMTLSFRLFPTGNLVPNTPSGTIHVPSGGAVTLTAPALVFGQGSPEPSYAFAFWDADDSAITTEVATFNAPSDNSDFDAFAWYFLRGGGGGSGITTYAFSLNKEEVIAGKTPIASVTPSGAWTGPPSTTVSTTTSANPVVITAASLIGGFGRFASWLQFGNGSASGPTLTVPAQGASTAIAFYTVPQPDPCDGIRTQLDNLNPSDYPNPGAYERAVQALLRELIACEKQYGEL